MRSRGNVVGSYFKVSKFGIIHNSWDGGYVTRHQALGMYKYMGRVFLNLTAIEGVGGL